MTPVRRRWPLLLRWLGRSGLVCLAGLAAMGGLATAETATESIIPSKKGAFRQTTAGGLAGLALPESFTQLLQDRLAVDAYQAREHGVAPGIVPSARPRYATPPRVDGSIRVVQAKLPTTATKLRAIYREPVVPPRGFIAPILHHHAEAWTPHLATNEFATGDFEAARLVEQRLAEDGLIVTLAQVLRRFGPEVCLANPIAAVRRLSAIGYPADLLCHYRPIDAPGAVVPARERPAVLVELVARRLLDTGNAESRVPDLVPTEFDFQPSVSDAPNPEGAPGNVSRAAGRFEVATEGGEHEIGLVRMQVGGGWRDGVLPGGSLDVVSQMVDLFRSADFLVSVAADSSAPLQSLITNSWRLRRRGHVTLCEEPMGVSAWAQDNGKAGLIVGAAGVPPRRATIVPRFACMDEGKSVYVPGESYLADGWKAAGHGVVHSTLLFQGGNILCIRMPRTDRRVLVLAEGDLHRNVALGLSRTEVLAAFKAEFGVEECVVVPGVSYHLDFDVSFRTTGSELIAFVNDTAGAARRIVGLGLAAMRKHQLLPAAEAAQAQEDLEAGGDAAVIEVLSAALRQFRGRANTYPATLSRAFGDDPGDDAAGNLQVFLLAVDVIESAIPNRKESASVQGKGGGRADYLAALRRMEIARRTQIGALGRLNCRVVPVPSMQDLYRSINYLNGLQHRGGYVMPVFGGFYAPLDQAAGAVIRGGAGAEIRVTPVRSSDCQRLHGGVHCTASVYP